MLLGRLRPVDAETGNGIPVKNLHTIDIPANTLMAYNADDPEMLTAYRVVQQQRNPRDFNRIRIKQELFFDFKNERLYSLVRSVILMQFVRLPYGMIIGQYPFCRLE
jgi:hypothetical protein